VVENSATNIAKGKTGGVVKLKVAAKTTVVEVVEVIKHKGNKSTQPVQDRKQYINIDSKFASQKAHPEYGRSVMLKARLSWISGDKSASLSGKKVYWYSKGDAKNKAGLKGDEKEGFETWFSRPATKETKVNKDGWTPEVEFQLSIYGGDKFEVYATDESTYKNGKKAGTYEVWRKLWVEMESMKKRTGGEFSLPKDALAQAYKDCYIEFENQGKDNKPNNKWNLMTSKLHSFANSYFGAERSPYQAQELAIDHQADPSDQEMEIEMWKTVFTSPKSGTYYIYDGGTSWVKSAKYRDASGPSIFGFKLGWKNLDKSKISLTGANKIYKKVKIDLTGGPVTPTKKKPVDIELKLKTSKEWGGDGTFKPHGNIATGFYEEAVANQASAAKEIHCVRVHEMGHLLGLVSAKSSTHIDTGTGHHCKDKNCIMYYQSSALRTKLCNVCKEYVRRADLSKRKGKFKHSKGNKA